MNTSDTNTSNILNGFPLQRYEIKPRHDHRTGAMWGDIWDKMVLDFVWPLPDVPYSSNNDNYDTLKIITLRMNNDYDMYENMLSQYLN